MENQPITKILRPQQIAKMLSISTTTLWRLRKESNFPSPVILGGRAIGYFKTEIEEWLKSRKVS